MKSNLIILLILALLVSCIFYLANNDKIAFEQWLKGTNGITNDFVVPSELKEGQRAYYLTVTKGIQREIGKLKYVGDIPHPYSNKARLYLFKIINKPWEDVTAVAGMSGSPVYIKQAGIWRLVGAYAYGLNTLAPPKEYLAGVTPIQAMLYEESVLGFKAVPAKLPAKKIQSPRGEMEINPLSVLSTSSASVVGKNSFGSLRELRPGDALSVVLVEGDITLCATGTVTYINYENKKFWAFGHPFLRNELFGQIKIPAYKTEICTTAMSQLNSHKIYSRLLNQVGTVTHDGVFACSGILGGGNGVFLPIDFCLKIGDKQALYKFKVIRQPRILNMALTNLCLYNLVFNTWSPMADTKSLMEAEIKVFVKNKQLLVFRQSAICSGAEMDVLPLIVNKISRILDNKWQVDVENIEINLHLRPQIETLICDDYFFVDESNKAISQAKLGQKIKLILAFCSENNKEKYLIQIPWQVPENIKLSFFDNTWLRIYIESGMYFQNRKPDLISPFKPENAEEFLNNLRVLYNNGGESPKKIFIQIVAPEIIPAVSDLLKGVKGLTAINLIDNKWTEMSSFRGIKSAAVDYSSKTYLFIYNSPNKKFIFDVNLHIDLLIAE